MGPCAYAPGRDCIRSNRLTQLAAPVDLGQSCAAPSSPHRGQPLAGAALPAAGRFFKQSLGWTTPRVRHPEQADRGTWLVLAAYTQLRMARPWVADRRLPWDRPLALGKLTPSRVRRGLSALLPLMKTPASPPKPCGRSPAVRRAADPGVLPATRLSNRRQANLMLTTRVIHRLHRARPSSGCNKITRLM
jgi:hypothetical protein